MKKLILLLLLFISINIVAQEKELHHTQLIPFEYNEIELTKENKAILDNMVKVHMNGHKLEIAITIAKSDDYHLLLGQGRRDNIIKHLDSLDIRQDRDIIIVTLGYGKKKSVRIYDRGLLIKNIKYN